MPRQNRKRSSAGSPGNALKRKSPRYNLRSRHNATPSESDSNSSVIFVGSSGPPARTTTITKKILKKRLNQAKVNARMNAGLSRHYRRSYHLTDAFSQTDESFKCASCIAKDDDPHEDNSMETIYANQNYHENDLASTTSKCNETGTCCDNPTSSTAEKQDAEPSEPPQNESNPEPNSVTCDPDPSTTPREPDDTPMETEQEDPPQQEDPNSMEESPATPAQPEQPEGQHREEHLQSSFEGTSESEPFLSPCGNFSMNEFASPAALSSQIESGCRLDDIPVSPIVPNDLCSGDGMHNNPLQVEVIDLGDTNLDEFLQAGSSNDSDDGPLI